MALTRVAAAGINTGQTFVLQNVNTSGIVTAGTVQVGSATTIHSAGIDLGGGNITSHNINSTGIITATGGFVGAVTGNVTGNLTGNVTGNVTGDLTGDVTGDLTGNVTGNVTGNLTGTATTASSLSGTPNVIVGVLTATDAVINGNLTVQGTTTTLDTTLTEVDRLEVGANNATVGVAITQSGTGDILRLYDGASQVVTVTAGGKVGIGTDTITGKVQIDTTSGGRALTVNAPTNGTYITFETNNTAYADIGSEAGAVGSGTNDLLVLNARSTRDLAFRTNSAERLRITSSGNVGIATTNPTETLHVEGNARVTGILTVGQNSTTINGALEYPSIRPTLDLNFAATKTLDRRITFTRDSLGTYIDELGVLKYASNNTPRFDHDPETGESLGLLIEESRTNLVTYSEDFSKGDWVENGASESLASSVTAPDGTTGSVYELIESSATSGHFMYDSVSVSSNTNYTWSVWMKSNTRTYGYITEGNTQATTAFFNLSTGTLISISGTGSVSATAQKYPNGWVRCTMTFITGASQTSANVQFGPHEDGSGFSYAGDGSSGIYVWGAQGEQGSFATSYIPTSGSTVTRADDNAVISGTNFTDLYNESEGTIFSEFNTKATSGDVSKWVVSINDETTNNYIAMRTYNQTSIALNVKTSGSTVVEIDKSNGVVSDQYIRSAGSFAANDFDGANGGELLTEDTTGGLPTGLTRMEIGKGWSNGQQLEGHIRSLKYYNKKLPNAQLQGLTAQ